MAAKQYATKNQWIPEEIKEEIKKYLETCENENMTIQNLWDAAKAVLRGKFIEIQAKREVHRDTSLPQETRKISNK